MKHISEPLKHFMDDLAKRTFGRTRSDSWAKGICVCCGLPALERCYSELGRKEYHISGMCEVCFDQTTKGGEE